MAEKTQSTGDAIHGHDVYFSTGQLWTMDDITCWFFDWPERFSLFPGVFLRFFQVAGISVVRGEDDPEQTTTKNMAAKMVSHKQPSLFSNSFHIPFDRHKKYFPTKILTAVDHSSMTSEICYVFNNNKTDCQDMLR